jgi:hypothetical protein
VDSNSSVVGYIVEGEPNGFPQSVLDAWPLKKFSTFVNSLNRAIAIRDAVVATASEVLVSDSYAV